MIATIPLTAITLFSLCCIVHGKHPEPVAQRRASPSKLEFTIMQNIGNPKNGSLSIHDTHPKKRNAFSETITNYDDLCYVTEVYLGSKSQKVIVSIDTGSADLWVPRKSYDPSISLYSQSTGEQFHIGYLGGESLHGMYYWDRIQLESDSSALTKFKFARANSARLGVLGIGKISQQASTSAYSNLPWALYEEGIIPHASYSLFSHPENENGTLIFGGIDTEKYSGELMKYRISNSSDALAIDLRAININGKSVPVNAPALFDSGTFFGLLGKEAMNELDNLFDGQIFRSDGIEYRMISCNQPTDKYIEFDFGKNVISLSYTDAMIKKSDGTCLLGFGYYGGKYVLGNVFLKKAYVFYNLSEESISIAQASDSGGSNIVSR